MTEDAFLISVTNKCNLDCMACPQETDEEPDFHAGNMGRLRAFLESQRTHCGQANPIVLTGGEPMASRNRLKDILQMLVEKKYDGEVTILSNGVLTPSEEVWCLMNRVRVRFEIPLYGVTAKTHDRITGSVCFYSVIDNILSYSRLGIPVTLRVVILRPNLHELSFFPEFVLRNMPSIERICLMGPEIRHKALSNFEAVRFDPHEITDTLTLTHREARRRSLDLLLFNFPMCFLNKSEWSISVQSISLWKTQFPLECGECDLVDKCCGLFATSEQKIYQQVYPKNEDENEF